MEVKVNKGTCIGCGVCCSMCASVFAFGDDGLAENVYGDVPADLEAEVLEAKESCPVGAIEA